MKPVKSRKLLTLLAGALEPNANQKANVLIRLTDDQVCTKASQKCLNLSFKFNNICPALLLPTAASACYLTLETQFYLSTAFSRALNLHAIAHIT